MIVSWGSPKGAILEALGELKAEGRSLSFLQVRLLWPLPARALEALLRRAKRRIAVENNYSGQLAGLIREQTGIKIEQLIVKYNGRPILSDELSEALKALLAAKPGDSSSRKVVLTHGI